MSGYFSALLRSTGLMAEAPGPSPSSPLDVLEVERIVGAAALPVLAAAAPDVAPAPPPVVAPQNPVPVQRSTPPAAPPVRVYEQAAAPEAPALQRTAATGNQPAFQPAQAIGQPLAATPASEPGPAPESPAAPAARLVQAAMQWVAADPALAAQTSPAIARRSPAADPPARSAQAAPPAQVYAPVRPAPKVARAIAQPIPSARIAAEAPPAHDDLPDISIGTIQIRVDAPPVPTEAPPQPAAAAATQPARSGLARRSLRRI